MGKLENTKREIFAHKVIEHNGDAKKAAVEVYGSYKNDASLATQANSLMNKPDVKLRIKELMNVIYSPEELQKDVQELRKATKPIVYNGEITDTHPDYGVRLDLLKLYMKVAGATGDVPTNQTNVQFNVGTVDAEAALKIAQEISKLSESITADKSGRRN